jgi:putative nucleotidyltransferase with HDIG domain
VRPADESTSFLTAGLRPAVALVTALGIAGGAFGAAFGTSGDVFALLAIAGFVAITQLLALRLDHGSVSVSAIGVLAGAALVGPRAALPLAVAAAAVDWAVRRLPLAEIFLDVAAISLGALAAAGIFAAAPPRAAGGAATIASGAVAGAAYFAVLALVYGLAAAAEGREPWWHAWRGRFAWILPHYGVSGFVAGVMAIAYRRADLYALAAFSVPLLALRETQSVFLGHAETSAERLRNATEKIQTQSISLERVNRLLRDRSAELVDGVCAIVAARDARTARHARRVQELALLVGRELGLSEADLEALGQAALFHDIGKLAVPEAILLKPWSLSTEEWAVVRRHPEEGARMVEQLGFLAHTAAAIRHHHEHFDGEGYPDGLKGERIPLDARIIHLTEAFDAMCTNQPYRPARPYNAALSELRWLAGSQFDPRCVGALERALAAAPEARASTSEPVS